MTQKHLIVIQDSIRHTMNTIETLTSEDYPSTPFEDREIRDMYYHLVKMSLAIGKKITEISQEQETA